HRGRAYRTGAFLWLYRDLIDGCCPHRVSPPPFPAASGDARQTRRDGDAYASVPPGQLVLQGTKLSVQSFVSPQSFLFTRFLLLNRIEAITACAPHAIQLPVRSGDMDVLPVGGKQYTF